jgi:hypothetical protein
VVQVSHCLSTVDFAFHCPRIYFPFDFLNGSGAHSSQALGSPINQRLWLGANWPPLVIPASEPVSISPEAVSRAGQSTLQTSTVLRLLSLLPAALFPFCAGVPAKYACRGN